MSQAKYGNSIKLFEDFYINGGNKVQTVVDTLFVKPFDGLWYKRYFQKATLPTPTNAEGIGIFSVNDIVEKASPMLLPRQPWSPPSEGGSEGFAFYTGNIGNFGYSTTTTDQEKQYYMDMLSQHGSDGAVLDSIIKKYFNLVNGAHSTLTNLSAQLLSYGSAKTQNTVGATFATAADISVKQRKKAGAKAWSDPTAPILDTMQEYEKEFRDETGYTGALSWKMDRIAFSGIQKNTDARNVIGSYITSNGVVFTKNSIVTVDAYNNYIREATGQYLSPIELVEEKQVVQDSVFRTDVSGWKSGYAVLSPLGMQGTIEYSNVKELAILSGDVDKQVAYLESGLFGVMNWVEKGRNNKYITELLAAFSPALTVFKHIVFVDTQTAN